MAAKNKNEDANVDVPSLLSHAMKIATSVMKAVTLTMSYNNPAW